MSATYAAAIAGMGYKVSQDLETRKTGLQLIIEAVKEALADANIKKEQIGAVFTSRAPGFDRVFQYNMKVINELKIAPLMSSEITTHGAGVLSTLLYASLAVTSGQVEWALCVSGDTGQLWAGKQKMGANASVEADPYFEAPFGPSTASLYAQIATRYMYEYGINSEQLARVAVEHRKWAVQHPYAQMRGKGLISIDDVLKSRFVASPLHLLDCASWYRGGVASAYLVTTKEKAEAVSKKPIYILGAGECSTHEFVTDRMGLAGVPPVVEGPGLTTTGAAVAAQKAFQTAGCTPGEIDLLETSVPFTFAVLLMLEDLGFCAKGKAGSFVEQGGIDFEDGFPVNTNGGMLSFGQSGVGCIGDVTSECILQLRGEALGKQVPNAKLGLVHGHGGVLACHSVALLSNQRKS